MVRAIERPDSKQVDPERRKLWDDLLACDGKIKTFLIQLNVPSEQVEKLNDPFIVTNQLDRILDSSWDLAEFTENTEHFKVLRTAQLAADYREKLWKNLDKEGHIEVLVETALDNSFDDYTNINFDRRIGEILQTEFKLYRPEVRKVDPVTKPKQKTLAGKIWDRISGFLWKNLAK